MTTARAALRSLAPSGLSLAELLTRVNAVLANDARHGSFMTLVLMIVDAENRRIRWANAGHNPPILYDPGNSRFIEVTGGDMPLGIQDGITYAEQPTIDLPSQAVIVVGTDGIWEALNDKDEMFGHERLRDAVASASRANSNEVLTKINTSLTDFCGLQRPKDDITAVVVRLTAP